MQLASGLSQLADTSCAQHTFSLSFRWGDFTSKCIRMDITIYIIFIGGRYIVGYTFGNHVLGLC